MTTLRAEAELRNSSCRASSTLQEERREVLDSVLQSLRVPIADTDRVAACTYLLRHLASVELHRPDAQPLRI